MTEQRRTDDPDRARGGGAAGDRAGDARRTGGEVDVVRDEDAGRYDLLVDGTPAGHVGFRQEGDRTVVVHTVVDDAYSGRGLGSDLARAVLDDVRARGGRVVPVCPFFATYVRRHPEDADLVAE